MVTNLKGLSGDCSVEKSLIRIHQSLSVEEARLTLFHEAIHAAIGISGHSEMLDEKHEESLVRLLENAFYHIVDVNKLSAGVDFPS